MSLKDVGEFIGVARKTALDFIKHNQIKFLKVGREYKILKHSLVSFWEVNQYGGGEVD